MRIKLSPSAVHSGAGLASLLCAGKFKVGYFLDSPRRMYYSGKEIEIFTLVRIFVLYYPSIVFQMTLPPAGYEKVKWGPH